MSWTKRQLIDAAFDEIALSSYIYDLEPEDITSALRHLDTMLSTWEIKGIRLGYPVSNNADGSDADQDSNLPEYAIEAVYKNLAIKIAPTKGKVVSAETKNGARQAYLALLTATSVNPSMQFDRTLPKGSGNKPIRGTNQEFFRPVDRLTVGGDSELDFNG